MNKIYSRICVIFFLSIFLTLGISAQVSLSITSQVNILCYGGNNGTATATVSGGTGPFTYSWNPTGGTNATATNLYAGSFTCTVTDQFDLSTATASVVITEPAQMTLTISQTNVLCFGGNNGTATANISGGTPAYTFSWAPSGQTSVTATGLSAGTYTCTVYDMNGCAATQTVTITQNPAQLAFTLSSTPSQCAPCNGTISFASFTNGTPPYNYMWSPFVSNTNAVCSGTYTCTVTDANGCVATNLVTVGSTSTLATTVTTVNSGCTACTGTATANPTGGTLPYSYLWSPGGGTTQTITNLCSGNYSVTVTDATGCQRFGNGVVGVNTGFTAVVSSPIANCSYNSVSGTVTVTGGVPPYTYLWTPSNQTTATATNLYPGIYHIIIGDQSGCYASVYDTVRGPGYINSYISTTPVNCGATSGNAIIHTYGGTPPYSYLWSNSTTNDTLTTLSGGNFSVSITDSHGCVSSGATTISSTCDNIVMGRVYFDPNSNCVFDNGDAGIFANVYTVPGNYQTTTNSLGYYNLRIPVAGNYTIYSSAYNYHTHCPVSGNYGITFPGVGDTLFNKDFAKDLIPNQDIAVWISSSPARPGFPMSYTVGYYNSGNVTVNNCVLTFNHPGLLNNFSASVTPTTYSAPTATWNLGTLTAGQSGHIDVYMNVPSTAVIGNSICATANIMPIAGDSYTPNNYTSDCRIIQGSFDPNEKTVNCAGLNPLNGNINQDDSLLTYHLYFQNTGTDTAFNIVLIDTLSQFLNPVSVVPGPSSDPYVFEMNNGVMKFNFHNILLPDSNRDEPNSHGWVSYQVKTFAGLPIGTVIDNSAEIYFDYNTAVVTNTTSNLIAMIGPSGITENTLQEIIAFPNPFDESVQLILPEKLNGKSCVITLTDIEGRIVLSQQNQNTNAIILHRGQLEAGIYFCTVRCAGTIVGNKKLVIK